MIEYDGPERRQADPQIALLAQRIEHLTARVEEWQTIAKEQREDLCEEVKIMREELTRYKGMLGGIAMVFSGIAVVLGLAKDWLLSR